jgi:hypothetical protein
MRWLYRNGVWAIYSALDPRALQFKPGILVDRELCDEILNRLDTAVAQARLEVFGPRARTYVTNGRAKAVRTERAA